MAAPAVASNLLMTVFLAADAYWVGTRLGAASLAAVTASVFWVWMGISVAEMVSIGLTAVAARRHGERRPQDAARAAGDALLLTLALGVAAAVAGRVGLSWMFGAMGTPEEVTAIGREYLGLYVLAAPVLYGYFVVDATFRASGDTRTPFLILAASVVLALALDPLLILGLGGFPRLGIAGAALATVTTRSLAFVVGLALLVRRGMLRVGAPRARVMATIARIGLPTAATGVLFSVVYVVVARTASAFGTPALAALGLGFRVESWLYMIGVGFGAAAAAVVGQNLGAGLVERAERAGWSMLGAASVPAVVASAAALLAPEALAGVFTSDAAVIATTASYLRVAAVSQLVVCAEVVLEGALGGAGATVAPMVVSTTLTAARIPLATWAGARFGVDGLWWVIAATATARGLAMMALWRLGRWKRNVV
ncbi:MATE family efflux transporter [Roseisolibacter agri]|uniref:Multidrug-efflux transporter n=1 Tax=Roseisolibacter agri TaxID=2014610 RepID=A0AA37QDW4_9BACT|nr:MATE family efflux transporter [Roseisolibacter agri]GLC27976.1 MATE family efflux transporter [Roseisolibacter agri]